ncbi:MAG: hypothetical protein Q9162_003809, partial [Coniocarpon cinnabarinum]
MLSPFLLTLLGAGTALSQNLFVTSYSGALTTLQLLPTDKKGSYQLTNVSVNLGCQPSPSQLIVDKAHDSLWCIGENAAGGNGSLTAYNIMNGTLAQRSNSVTYPGPVWGQLYGKKTDPVRGLALAHYGDKGVSTWSVANDLTFTPILPNITFPNPNPPGPVKASQSASHPHATILDPTGQFIVVPDLGTDLVHVFTFDGHTGALKEAGKPLKTDAGMGPRHAAFTVQGKTTIMYLVGELNAKLNGYTVQYPGNPTDGLKFTQIYSNTTLGDTKSKNPVAPAEVNISPCNGFLTVSNRNDSTFLLENPDSKNTTKVPSDSLATYKIQPDGKLNFVQLWPAGGSFPRDFEISKRGDMVAVGLQNDGRVVVFSRDVNKGTIGRPIA